MGASIAREVLVERVRSLLQGRHITTKRMFGVLAFMLDGNMLCCASNKGLMARVGAAAEAEALARPHAARCMGAGRPMAGFILVEPAGVAADADLKEWLGLALAYVGNLPPKEATPARRRSSNRSKRSLEG